MALRSGTGLLALATIGAAPPPERIVVPIRPVVLSDGTLRFGVAVRVAGQVVEAGLDTGSTGLRIMARALAGGSGAGRSVRYGFGAGTVLVGPEIEVPVALGAASAATIRVQRVEALSCMADKPRCPVSRNADPATFGIQSDGIPDEGFVAILGVNLRPGHQPNPFEALGARRWIVELPRPGETAPGRLILNPTAAETAGYRTVHLLADDDTLPACITGDPPLGVLCGPATIDSGAPGLRVVQAAAHSPVPDGLAATITIGKGAAATVMVVRTGRRDEGSHPSFERRPDAGQTRLFLGTAPYYRFSVLYDADAHTIGFRPR